MCSGLTEADDTRNGAGKPLPLGGFPVERAVAGSRQRVVLRPPAAGRDLPLCAQPPFLFEFVEGGVQRSIAYLQIVARHLTQPLADGPRMERLERDDGEEEEIQRSLDEVGGLGHLPSVTEVTLQRLPSVSKGKRLECDSTLRSLANGVQAKRQRRCLAFVQRDRCR